MKRNIILAIALSVFCAAACSDFLTEAPTTSLSESSVYGSEGGLESAITGCYQSMQSGNGAWQKNMLEFIGPTSGLIAWKGNRTGEDWQQTTRLTTLPASARNSEVFDHFYSSINKCNKLIESVADSPVDQTFKNEVEGEARLIRAINYFSLTRFYGDVPLLLQSPKTVEQASAPRTSYMQIYKQVLEDLEFAETHMRDEARQAQVSGTAGRPHKWAATSMKVAVYAQIACIIENKDYQFFDLQRRPERAPDFSFAGISSAEDAWRLCLETAEDVIKNSGYELAQSYADLFKWGPGSPAYNLKERIFVLQSNNSVVFSNITLRSMPQFPADTKNMTTKNSNWGRIRPSRWPLVKWASVHGGVKWTDRKDGLENLYKTCLDPRYELSYYHTFYMKWNKGKESKSNIWPADNNANGHNNNNWYLPFFKKYVDPEFDVTNGYADFYLMRYAEIILYAAEAAASLNQKEKALEYMELIHARARRSVEGGSEYPRMSDWGALATKEELVDAIMWERVFELHGENHEFFDSHRRGGKWMAEWITKPLNKFNAEPEQNFKVKEDSKTFMEMHYFGYKFEEDPQRLRKAVLMPYPDKDLRNNTALTEADQNDFFYATLDD